MNGTLLNLSMTAPKIFLAVAAVLLLIGVQMVLAQSAEAFFGAGDPEEPQKEEVILLPDPTLDGEVSLESALSMRRSCRAFRDEEIALGQAGQLLWAAQGITDFRRGFRTAPSAGATFPLETYLVAGRVQGVVPGVYRYSPEGHELRPLFDGDLRGSLVRAALGQGFIGDAPAVFVVSAVFSRTSKVYGDRALRYVHMEAGHAAQNLCLQAAAIGLGTVVVGAFRDEEVNSAMNLPEGESVLYLIPAGIPGQ